ncbi:hypothetical protein COCOBI_19-0060 [Coccomyxa sp. Obi]|nr:hypothetical protein COCOBI_19-0060 [Coccomyxa sp. Obi]
MSDLGSPPGAWSSYGKSPPGTAFGTGGSGNTGQALLQDRGTGASADSRRSHCPVTPQDRPSLGHLVLLPLLLLGIACLSAAPLAGVRSGWAYFYKENVESMYLRDLTFSNWTHWIDIGFYQQSNAIRNYGWEHHWVINGKGPMERYSMLWDNLQYGDATQLVGGYTAGYLVISCATALVYLGLWLRCVIVQNRWRQDVGDLEAPPGGPPSETTKGAPPINKHLIRPLGPWLWPAALTHTVLLAVLVVTFFLLMDATTAYQSRRIAPGVECHVAPAWAWWCAMSAVFAWLTVTIMASIEAVRQGHAKTAAREAAARGRQPSSLPPLRPPPRSVPRSNTSAASSA